MDDSIYWIAIMNQMFLFQLAYVVVTFNNVIIISTLTTMQQKFSSQSVTLYPQGGQLAGYKRTSWFQFIIYCDYCYNS